MKRHNHLIAQCMAGIVLLTAASCQSDDNASVPSVGKPIDIEATIGNPTRIAYDGNTARFTQGDCITLIGVATGTDPLTAPGNKIQTSTYKLGTEKWSSPLPLLWYDTTEAQDFYAIYPALDGSAVISNMQLAEGDANANDVMLACKKVHSAKDGAVSLAFAHAMSKLVVNLTKLTNEITNPSNITVKVCGVTESYAIDLVEQKITPVSGSNKKDYALTKQGESNTFVFFLPGQEGVNKITITDGIKSFTWTNNGISLIAGKITTVSLQVGENLALIGSVNVTDWDDATIEGGEIEK